MMGRSHLAVSAGVVAAGAAWLGVLGDPLSGPASALDRWVGDAAHWAWSLVGAEAPWWLASAPVSTAASAVRDWLFPVAGQGAAAVAGYAAIALGLLWLGSLLPDVDSRTSILGRRLPLALPGPHRGLTHTDWALWALFAASVPSPTRALVFCWLGAWLHCEIDGLSRAGRARFYPLGAHRTISLADGERCVVRAGRHVGLYRSGQPAERAVLGGVLALCAGGLVGAALL